MIARSIKNCLAFDIVVGKGNASIVGEYLLDELAVPVSAHRPSTIGRRSLLHEPPDECQRRLGDPHDAEEAAQETLVKAYRALPSFGGDRRFYPWLRVIAANVCNDCGKRKPVAALADPDGGDVVVDSLWTVCSQVPAPGERGHGVDLYVSHDCW